QKRPGPPPLRRPTRTHPGRGARHSGEVAARRAAQPPCETGRRVNAPELDAAVVPLEPWPRAFHHTDLGNAERLVDRHGDDIRHAEGMGWLVWDGRRWQRDIDGTVMRRM